MKSISTTILMSICLLFLPNAPINAQHGSEEIYKDIKKLGVLANVLYLAAHPDDENTRMISYLSNHLSVNTTYLSMTRGDGGQNLIGPEMREMLGLIRTQELLAARNIDGGSQLFTRANDFGYSKTPAETFTIWDRNAVLSDVVWAIRKVQPDVIINRFNSDTSRPNHGHHTASAILSEEAFDLSGNAAIYPEQLTQVNTWQPQRVFWNTHRFFYGSQEAFDQVDKSKMLALDIGAFDQVTGQSCSEIAGRSRSMHKSQGFGSAESRGESLDYLILVKDANGKQPTSLFDGIDITWNRVSGGSEIAKRVDLLENTFNFKDPSQSIPLLLDIHKSINALSESYWKTKKLSECEELIKSCMGLFIEVSAEKFKASPGSILPVTFEIINRSNQTVSLLSLKPSSSDSTFYLSEPLPYNIGLVKELQFKAPTSLSTPYWLEEKHTEGLYTVSDQMMRGIPYNPPAIDVVVNLIIDGKPFSFNTPVIFQTVDPAEGQITRPLSILPPVTVEAHDEVLVFKNGVEREIQLTLTAVQDSVRGELRIKATEPGWTITPKSIEWSFSQAGETMLANCTIIPPNNTSEAELVPEIIVEGVTYHHKITTINYSHLPYMSVVRDASVKMQSMDIETTPRRIGYITGAGDDVPASLRQIGYNVDIIDPDALSPANLANYEVVILGVRAFNTVESLAHKNKILFDWTEAGGTMIVQYNVNRRLVTENFSPYPIALSRTRTTEENAPVRILDPEHPAMQFPNKINTEDFQGWIQERGLYYPGEWDDHFVPLLEMHDTGEEGAKGSLLVTQYGSGYYVYSGLSWFRHLPAGNPGPYRLLSNLISLGYKNDKS